MASVKWPHLREEDQWLTGAFEELLEDGHESADEMQARARELRQEADQAEIGGVRNAKLALAECFERAAASRLAT